MQLTNNQIFMKRFFAFFVLMLMLVPSWAQRNIRQAQQSYSRATRPTNNVSDDATRRKAINDFFNKAEIRAKDNASALTIKLPSEKTMDPVIIVGTDAMQLEKEPRDIKSSSESFFVTNYDNIYPGAIVWADQALADGDPTLAFSGGKVDLRVNFRVGNRSSSALGVDNNANAVQDAFFAILDAAQYSPAVNYQSKDTYSSSVSEMAVGLKANANFLQVKAGVNVNVSTKESKVYKVQDYTQEYYTVYATQNPTDKSQYFADNVTAKQIEDAINRHGGAPIAIITSVTYGRRAYRFYEYTSSNYNFSGDENVQAYGQSLSSTQQITQNSEARNSWMYLSGGSSSSGSEILKGSDINDAMANDLKYDKSTNQGYPIAYTVRFLNTGNTAKVTTTGRYYTYSYKKIPGSIHVIIRNNCTHVAGADMKVRLDYKCIWFDKNGEKHYVDPQSGCYTGYQRWAEWSPGFGDTKNTGLGPWDTPVMPNMLPNSGYYIEGPLHLQIRCKICSTCSWCNSIDNLRVAPTNGVIDLDIHGAVRSGGKAPYIFSGSKTQPF